MSVSYTSVNNYPVVEQLGVVRPTAIFCATDLYAIYAMRYLQQKGLKIPEDISIIGIDDIEISTFTTPALTTVRVDREELGKIGFELLMDCIAGKQGKSLSLEPAQLIQRGSTMNKTDTAI